MRWFVRGAGSGSSRRVTVPQRSRNAMARIGRRWISFEPATTFWLFAGLIAMNVSLCEPHSWLASTLLPYASCPVEPLLPVHTGVAPLETLRYLSYHDAPSYLLRLPASAGAAVATSMVAAVAAARMNLLMELPLLPRWSGLIEVPLSHGPGR